MPRPTSAFVFIALVHGLCPVLRASPPAAPRSSGAITKRGVEPIPVAVTVDDLPIISNYWHRDPAERLRITQDLLAILDRHHIRTVGFVTGKNHPDPSDEALLARWVAAGHELGSHSWSHFDYTATAFKPYWADVERENAFLRKFLRARGKELRLFRFPFLSEGDTPEKLEAMRAALASAGLRSVPVTIDVQDWSYESAWVLARRAGKRAELERLRQEYQSNLRLHVLHFDNLSRELFGREVPQILIVHALEISAAQWDELFTWLVQSGHRFANIDEVLADPAFLTQPDYVAQHGCSHWYRLEVERRSARLREELASLVEKVVLALGKGDLAEAQDLIAPDALYYDAGGPRRGREALIGRLRTLGPGPIEVSIQDLRLHQGEEISLFGDITPSAVHAASVVLHLHGGDGREGNALAVFRHLDDHFELVQLVATQSDFRAAGIPGK